MTVHIASITEYNPRQAAMTAPITGELLPVPLETLSFDGDPDNHASMRIIERLGASFVDEVAVPPHDPHYQRGSRSKRRYRWAP